MQQRVGKTNIAKLVKQMRVFIVFCKTDKLEAILICRKKVHKEEKTSENSRYLHKN